MPEKYPYICPDCGKRYELTIPILHPKCWKCGAELVVEGAENLNAAGEDSVREEKPQTAKEDGRTNAADAGLIQRENTQPEYTRVEEDRPEVAPKPMQQTVQKKNAEDDCLWAMVMKATGWIGVAGAAIYGAMTFGFLGLCIGLGAGLLAASGIMTVAEMAKDIRRIRKMMEKD